MLGHAVPQAVWDRAAVAYDPTSLEDDRGWRYLPGRSPILRRRLAPAGQDHFRSQVLTPGCPEEGGDRIGVLVRRQGRQNPAHRCQARLPTLESSHCFARIVRKCPARSCGGGPPSDRPGVARARLVQSRSVTLCPASSRTRRPRMCCVSRGLGSGSRFRPPPCSHPRSCRNRAISQDRPVARNREPAGCRS